MKHEFSVTPTLLITDIGSIVTCPSLLKNLPSFLDATKLGMALDDFYDFEVPKPISLDNYPNIANKQIYPKWQKVEDVLSNSNLIKMNDQIASNTKWFTSKIHYIEGFATSTPFNKWSFEKIRDYRESVCMIWAVYLSCFSDREILRIKDINNTKGFDKDFWLEWINKKDGNYYMQKDTAKKLYYSSLIFQIISDYGKREYSVNRSIPSFFVNPDIDLYDKDIKGLLDNYMKSLESTGCNMSYITLFIRSFNKIQSALDRYGVGKEWLYS